MIRDLSINGETDATHMLPPMPLAISLGVGSQSVPYVMPAVENINGQAITRATKHKGVKAAEGRARGADDRREVPSPQGVLDG